MTEINGNCDSKFNKVKEVFAHHFDSGLEIGASVAVFLDGKPVVDLWAGHADSGKTVPWEQDTIVMVWSTTKGMAALSAHKLIDQGKLDLDAPVSQYWPEFAQEDKGSVPVNQLLSHRAGLPAIAAPLPTEAYFDWDTMAGALAAQKPWWEPGTAHGYHAFTYGWLVGEPIRRITGKSLGTFFRDEIGGPLGADVHIGLEAKHDARTAETIQPILSPDDPPSPLAAFLSDPESMQAKVMTNPPRNPGVTENSREWRAAEIPAANGHTNARALARVYSALSRGGELDGVRILDRSTIEAAIVEQANGVDAVLGAQSRFALGFGLDSEQWTYRPGRVFGHTGAGGSVGLADLDNRLSFSYTMNQMKNEAGRDKCYVRLMDAAYDCL